MFYFLLGICCFMFFISPADEAHRCATDSVTDSEVASPAYVPRGSALFLITTQVQLS